VSERVTNDMMVEFVDFLMPLLTPSETTVYRYLLRRAHLGEGSSSVRVGKRTIARDCGRGARAASSNFGHVTEVLTSLEARQCVSIGDTTREGTLYTVALPLQVPLARERKDATQALESTRNDYRDPALRETLFRRDAWTCQYCGERVSSENATLDHRIPVSKGGVDSPENLVTCCLVCNAIKSGRSYEEAAADIPSSLRGRRSRQQPDSPTSG